MAPIPFNCPTILPEAFEYLQQAVINKHLSGDGLFTHRCHQFLEELLGVKKALLTTSCTHALEMAAILLNIQPGDEVLVPDFTFVSTVNAFVLRGARPVFVDIRPDTLNMDENLLPQLITSRTRAIVPVHYAGVGCEMDAILALAHARHIAVVEDNAHGLFGKYRGQYLGTLGCMATQSFHETKNFTCGEGGALLLNDPALVQRAEIIREKGTNRSRFFRGEVDKYTWVDIGSSFLLSDVLAALLFAQFERHQFVQAKRARIWHTYATRLEAWAAENRVGLPIVPPHCEQAYHMFYLLFPSLDQRQAFIAHLKTKKIYSVFHYLPLHLSEMGQRLGARAGDCPVSQMVSDRLVRLPFHNDLTEVDQERVIEAVRGFKVSSGAPSEVELLASTATRSRRAA